MNDKDIRLKVSWKSHRKRRKLQGRLGGDGVIAWIDLLLSVAEFRPNGILTGYSTEDIAMDAQWLGEDSAQFVNVLVEIGLLDVLADGAYAIHDWLEHNPWASGADTRSARARFNSLRKHYPALAKELEKQGVKTLTVEEYQSVVCSWTQIGCQPTAKALPTHCQGTANPLPRHANGSAPSPSPSPSPFKDSVLKKTTLKKRSGGPENDLEFLEFWEACPRKVNKLEAFRAWGKLKARPNQADLLAALEKHKASPEWQREGGRYIPHPASWLNGRRWEDEFLRSTQSGLPVKPVYERPPDWAHPDELFRGLEEEEAARQKGLDQLDKADRPGKIPGVVGPERM